MIFNNSGMMRFNDDEDSSKDKNQSTENKPPQTIKEINKEGRMQRRAVKLVQKKYGKDVLGDPEKMKSAMDKERKGMDKRRERGRQFFVELAKNLASDDTPYVPKERKPNPTSNGGVEGSTGYEWKKGYTRSGNSTDVTTPEEDKLNNNAQEIKEKDENTSIDKPGNFFMDFQ